MPIDYSKYSKDWKLRSRFIRFYRADNMCEQCGAINHSYVNKYSRELCLPDEEDAVRIVLTVAHLDHDINNNSFFNIKALCQKCHLRYDSKHHAETRRKKRFKNQLELGL